MVLEPHTFAVVHQRFNEETQKHPSYLMEQHLKCNSIESNRMSFVWMKKESLNSCAFFFNTTLLWNNKKRAMKIGNHLYLGLQ